MKIHVDDWHFQRADNDILLVDVYLDNGQHGMLEINPIRNPKLPDPQVPEIIVFCEMPGERLTEGNCPARWLSRPPNPECAWSHLELPPVLVQQINERMGQPVGEPAHS